MSLSEKVAIITGGGTGIGRACAERFAKEGAKVVVCGRRAEPLAEIAEQFPNAISYVQADVGKDDERAHLIHETLSRHGKLDILVNNAAVSYVMPFADHSPDMMRQTMDVNLTAPMLLMQAALPELMKTKGNIVNVSSAGARYQGMPPAMIGPYSASKAGLNQISKVLATELGPMGIRVNVVAPGFTDTDMAKSATEDPQVSAGIQAITPLARVGTPADIAKVVHFLASDEAAWVTGQIVDATGGLWLS